jgi:hypothetical protein
VLRKPPFHLKEVDTDSPSNQPHVSVLDDSRRTSSNLRTRPWRHPESGLPYAWPRISAVEYGNGWRPPSKLGPRSGTEVVLRIEGGMEWCPSADTVHPCSMFRRTWVVLSEWGMQIACCYPPCVRAKDSFNSVRGPARKLPPHLQANMERWLSLAREAALPPQRLERSPSPRRPSASPPRAGLCPLEAASAGIGAAEAAPKPAEDAPFPARRRRGLRPRCNGKGGCRPRCPACP